MSVNYMDNVVATARAVAGRCSEKNGENTSQKKKVRKLEMKNIRNQGMVIGRLARDPMVYNNRGGSRKILLTVAAQDNYVGKNGKRESQFVSLEAFVKGNQRGNGVYDYLNTGDLVSCSFSVRNNTYVDKNGETIYGQVLLVDEVALLESKMAKEARLAAKEEAATAS